LAESLGIDLVEIPTFLERYADVYLSLAYYAEAIDHISKPLTQLTEVLERIRRDPRFQRNRPIMKACERIEFRVIETKGNIANILDVFRMRTQHMWRDINGQNFRAMEQLIMDYQRSIGGNLCALVVKMDAWGKLPGKGSLGNCVQFIMSELSAGVDRMPDLDLSVVDSQSAVPSEKEGDFEWVA
jgi:hypothetical protein